MYKSNNLKRKCLILLESESRKRNELKVAQGFAGRKTNYILRAITAILTREFQICFRGSSTFKFKCVVDRRTHDIAECDENRTDRRNKCLHVINK